MHNDKQYHEERMICQYCKISKANSKRRPLCKQCYRRLHAEGLLGVFPLLPDRNLKSKLIAKHGESIIDDLKNINLMRMQDKYGFTREYARQLFEKIYGFKYTVIKNQRADKRRDAKRKETLLKKDPRIKLKTYTPTCNLYKGAIAEKKVLEICTSLGYEVRPYPEDKSIDLIINGYLVEVKSAYKSHMLNRGQKTPSCNFNLRECQGKTDFVVFYMDEQNKFFIIPKAALPKKSLGAAIAINKFSMWPNGRMHQNKYYEYLEAWHLLKRKEEVIFSKATQPERMAIQG